MVSGEMDSRDLLPVLGNQTTAMSKLLLEVYDPIAQARSIFECHKCWFPEGSTTLMSLSPS